MMSIKLKKQTLQTIPATTANTESAAKLAHGEKLDDIFSGLPATNVHKNAQIKKLYLKTKLGTLLSVEEVASLLGVSSKTVKRWIKSGLLAASKPGNHWKIPEKAVDKLLKAKASTPFFDGS